MGPEALAEVLCRHITGPDHPGAAVRAERLVQIARKMLDLEVAEEGLIEASEATGSPLARRADADPRAVLGMRE